MREFALEVLKRLLTALREERFADVTGLVDESALNEKQIADLVRGAIGSDDLKLIVEFRAENILYSGAGNKSSYDIVYDIGADGGKRSSAVIRLGVIPGGDGSVRTTLNMERTKAKSVVLLDDTDEYGAVWSRVYGELGFKPGMRESVPFSISEPHAVYDIGNMTEKDIDGYVKACGEIFSRISKGRVCALDWQHSGLLYDPRDPEGQRDFWTVNSRYDGGGYNVYFPSFYPDGDYYFFIDEGFEFGLLGHPWRREIWVFGEPLLAEFAKIYKKLGIALKENDNGKSIQKADH